MCIIVCELSCTSTTELIHNHPSQTPQMLGRKEVYAMQRVFLLDFFKHFCSFHLIQKHLFSNSQNTASRCHLASFNYAVRN